MRTPIEEKGIDGNNEGVNPFLGHGCEAILQLRLVACIHNKHLDPDGPSRLLDLAYLRRGQLIFRVHKRGDHYGFRHNFVQQLEPLLIQPGRQQTDASSIPAWPTKTGDETDLNWIAAEFEDNGNC